MSIMIISLILIISAAVGAVVFVSAKYFGPGGGMQEEKNYKNRISKSSPATDNISSRLRQKTNISEIDFIREFLNRRELSEKLTVLLKTSKLKVSVSVFLLFSFIFGGFSLILLRIYNATPFTSLVISSLFAITPFLYLQYRRKRYLAKFSEHFPNALASISGSVKAGRSLESAIDVAAETAPHPVSAELEIVRAETSLGIPLPKALDNLYHRIKNHELKIFLTGVAIHQELGGNLSEVLDNLERTIRERFAMLREIKTLSAQGRYSAWVLMAMPFVLIAFYLKSDANMFFEFTQSGYGSKVVWMAIGLNIAGFLWLQKIVRLQE